MRTRLPDPGMGHAGAWCHQCGLPAEHPVTLTYARGERHVFCDGDCARQWIDDRHTLAGMDALRGCGEGPGAPRGLTS
jgi:hypothetical protein